VQIPEHLKPLREKVLRFMEDRVYPAEEEIYRSDAGLRHHKIKELQAEAKRQGLWALGHPKDVMPLPGPFCGGFSWSCYATGALARIMKDYRDPAISLELHAESPESALAVQNLHKNSYATGYGYGFGGQG